MGRSCKLRGCLVVVLLTTLAASQTAVDAKDSPKEKWLKATLLDRKPLKADLTDDDLKKLQIDQYNEAVAEIQTVLDWALNGPKHVDPVRPVTFMLFDASKRLVWAGLEVYDKPADRITLLTEYLELAKELERVIDAQHDLERIHEFAWHQARYYRLDAEIELLKAKRAAEKPKDK